MWIHVHGAQKRLGQAMEVPSSRCNTHNTPSMYNTVLSSKYMCVYAFVDLIILCIPLRSG